MSEQMGKLSANVMADFTNRFPPRTEQEQKAIEASKKEERDQARLRAIQDLIKAAEFPLRHLSCTPCMDGPWGAKFKELQMKLGTGRLLALIGTRGNGKTQLAVALGMDQIRTHLKAARFTTATAFFMAIKSTYKPTATDDEAEIIREFAKPPLLLIDEIGKRGGSEWENNLLFELLNRRYNDMKDTILIDNRTVQEFTETIGPSLASRMNEGGGVVHCDWETFRK
jgi:DNA replication protein DnaC